MLPPTFSQACILDTFVVPHATVTSPDSRKGARAVPVVQATIFSLQISFVSRRSKFVDGCFCPRGPFESAGRMLIRGITLSIRFPLPVLTMIPFLAAVTKSGCASGARCAGQAARHADKMGQSCRNWPPMLPAKLPAWLPMQLVCRRRRQSICLNRTRHKTC